MKIAVLASRFPYPIEKGDKLRLFHQLRSLARLHEIVLIALAEEPPSDADIAAIKAIGCSRIHILPLTKGMIFQNLCLSVFQGLPLQVGFFYNSRIDAKIQAIVDAEQPDRVYCQLIRMAKYAKNLDVAGILDYMDNFSVNTYRRAEQSTVFTRWFWLREARQTRHFEALAAEWFSRSVIISAQDRDLLPFADRDRVTVIPNGVDTAFFTPALRPNAAPDYDFAFVGNMGYQPNIDAARFLAEQIMPLVWQKEPSARLLIAGARPALEVQRLQNERVTVSGWLDDIRDAYRNTICLVAPLFTGSGQQNKILESMAMSVPCITTTLVNNAIHAETESEILLADDAESFARQMLRLHADAALRAKISAKGLDFVQKNYSWTAFGKLLSDLF